MTLKRFEKKASLSISEVDVLSKNFMTTMKDLSLEFSHIQQSDSRDDKFRKWKERVGKILEDENISDEDVVECFASFATNNLCLFDGVFISGVFVFLKDSFFTGEFDILSKYKLSIDTFAKERERDVSFVFSGNENMIVSVLGPMGISWTPLSEFVLRGSQLETVITDFRYDDCRDFQLYHRFSVKEILPFSKLPV